MRMRDFDYFDGKLYFIAPKDKEKWYKHKYFIGRGKRRRVDRIIPIWEKCFETWKDSSFDIELIDDEDDLNDMVTTYDPKFLKTLEELPVIYKIDYVKYLILGHLGGGYADIDMELNADFRKLIKKDDIYLVGNHENSLQNSLMFSYYTDKFWDIMIENVRKAISDNKKKILEAVKLYAERNRYKKRGVDTKDTYLDIAAKTIGSDQMIVSVNQYKELKTRRKIHTLPSNLFNNSVGRQYKFVTHWCTGLWRKHGRIFGKEGREILDEFLKRN